MSAVHISCGYCQHTGHYRTFCHDVAGRDLPADQYRCPHCKARIRLVPDGDRAARIELLVAPKTA